MCGALYKSAKSAAQIRLENFSVKNFICALENTRMFNVGAYPHLHWPASFPGSHAPECEHWSCAGIESLVLFLTWVLSKVEREKDLNCALGYPPPLPPQRLRTWKWANIKLAGNLLHVSSYRGANIIHIEHQTHSWLNNVGLSVLKTLVLFRLHCGHMRQKYQALHVCIISILTSGVWEPGKKASSETRAQLQWRHLTGFCRHGTLLHTMLFLPFLYEAINFWYT